MTYVVLLLITAFNCVALFFSSLLAAGGDGSADGIHKIWLFGYPWVTVFAVIALIQCVRGKRSRAIAIASSTLPAGYATALVGMLIASSFNQLKPNTPELEAACESAGPRYVQKPTAIVESIAYDWEPGTYPPDTNYFEIDKRKNVSNLRGGLPRFPSPIKFIEGRCCQFEGAPSNGVRPYVHHTNSGEYFGTTELTADALVTYKVTHTTTAGSKSELKTVDMAVTDRRDGRALATLRYVLDEHGRRGCGVVSESAMDEQAFILRAIGVN
jgi:hypothetical protein